MNTAPEGHFTTLNFFAKHANGSNKLGCLSFPEFQACCNVTLYLVGPMEQHALKNVNNNLNMNIYSYLETSGGQSSYTHLNVVYFSTPVIIKHLWQLTTVVFLHWCLICSVPFVSYQENVNTAPEGHFTVSVVNSLERESFIES